jgi:UDP-GlcNAc:undecaprenyl-phosphate GlcNAc-1-phosphate transferase
MTTILAIFIIAFLFSLVLTPLLGKLGLRFGAVDEPDERKIHTKPITRCGGMGIFVSFFLTLAVGFLFFKTSLSDVLVLNSQTALILLGALIAFGIGLVDDFHRLGSTIKFLFHILGATLAFLGGLKIGYLDLLGLDIQFGIMSYFITVFWFVLLINAVNLIDGLDGLAGGITFFACTVMVILAIVKGNFLIAMLFAALGGSTLGFLRYNFNPATIFLGDGGSYFLGYSIAALSIMGSIKTQMGALMLIPLVGLGVPLFDTILSPIRRFIIGSDMFNPDKGHIHHKLVGMGLSTKRAVWIIYAISICLCAFSLLLVNLRDEQVGLFLIVLAAASVIFLQKLGYFEYFTSDKIFGWLQDLTDEAGIKRDRRTFLSMQMHMAASENMYQLWGRVIQTAEKIQLNSVHLELNPETFSNHNPLPLLTWENGVQEKSEGKETDDRYLRLEVPIASKGTSYATLRLSKSLKYGNNDRFALQRVEHLRRTITGTMEKLATHSVTSPEVLKDRRHLDNHTAKAWPDHERRILPSFSSADYAD